MCSRKPILYAFDFDGTLTKRDSLVEFIQYAKGSISFLFGFTVFSPYIILMKLKILPNWKVKQKLFSWYFKGMEYKEFKNLCYRFAKEKYSILKSSGLQYINEIAEKGDQIIIVSASVDDWVEPFFQDYPIRVLGTKLEVIHGKLTGKFKTKNCYGIEKVNRIVSEFPHRNDYLLIALGDSQGDKEMLDFADQSYYKYFAD